MSGPEGEEETPESAPTTALQDPACPFGYDSFGAMDLSSCASSKAHDTDDNEDAEDEEGGDEEDEEVNSSDSGKRGPHQRLDGGQRSAGKRKWREEEEEDSSERGTEGEEEDSGGDKSMQSLPPKIRNKRRNIKSVMEEERLEAETKAAKAEEQERLTRLAEQQKQLYLEVRSWTIFEDVFFCVLLSESISHQQCCVSGSASDRKVGSRSASVSVSM
jgi:hypothetical protein